MFFIIFILMTQHTIARGRISSGNRWEPQSIYIYESNHRPDRIIFDFCHTKQRVRCFPLAKKEGILKNILFDEAKFYRKLSRNIKLLSDTGILTLTILSFTVAKRYFQTLGSVIIGGMSQSTTSFLLEEEFSERYWQDMEMMLNPDKSKDIIISPQQISMKEFAQNLQEILRKLSLPCREDSNSQKCFQYKQDVTKKVDEINHNFQGNLMAL